MVEEDKGVEVSERVLVSCRDVREEDGRKELVWEKATVRYIGEVDEQKGTWFGIEWDKAERGKHDGQVEGKQYFACRKTWVPASASFVREKRLKRGVTLVEAIREKYCGGVSSEDLECDMFIHTSSNHRLPVTLVGQDSIVRQQSVLEELKAVYLNGSDLNRIGPTGVVSESVPKISELDLSSTLLSSWSEVAKLSQELPRLELLDISRNEINWAASAPELSSAGAIFQNLTALVLNNCCAEWVTVAGIAGRMPSLKELHLAGNRIVSLGCDNLELSLGKIEVLHLEDNRIADWAEVKRLSALTCLKKLNMSGNLLTDVDKYSEAHRPGFVALETLFLSGNVLQSWEDIDAFDHFESLKEIRVSSCKFLEGLDMIASRLGVIARLPRVSRLNGSVITPKERVDAEIGYLTEILTESVGKEIKDIEATHPQFKRLLASYRNINKNTVKGGGAGSSGDRTTIAKTLLAVEISLVTSLDTKEAVTTIKKKLPSNLMLNKFKVLVQRLFKVSGASIYIDREDAPEELLHAEDTLQQLGVEEGQRLLVVA
ncbi:tubulin-specific chaperone E [Chloropicon primus]|uniref:Tubulin-specific chaperone E n=1 Tax=Chloropicon primus TaxID=1764295 RepID=A0A5B8MTZ8_9CHLO|nr:tubulin-specific chaperone E [Chloropicon primus]UPR03251.1 tubulin-specific chaperone E [Chloropicon primus]|eukprot:QDZ24039.1 tubulin-specific chaperone E [Chloropicon primus]